MLHILWIYLWGFKSSLGKKFWVVMKSISIEKQLLKEKNYGANNAIAGITILYLSGGNDIINQAFISF